MSIRDLKLSPEEEWAVHDATERTIKLPYEVQIELHSRVSGVPSDYIWPEDMLPKPYGWDEKSADLKAYWFHWLGMFIEQNVGRKAISRYKKKAELGWNDQQFDDWWDSNFLR